MLVSSLVRCLSAGPAFCAAGFKGIRRFGAGADTLALSLMLVCVSLPVRAQISVQTKAAPLWDHYGAAAGTYASALDESWALTQAAVDTCNPGSCLNGQYATNLVPKTSGNNAYLYNGQWYWNWFDLVVCVTPQGGSTTCNTTSPYGAEPPRLSRRPHYLRGWGYGDDNNQVFTRSQGTCGADGLRASQRASVRVGNDRFDLGQDRLYGGDAQALGGALAG